MAGLQVVRKRVVDHGPILVEFDLQLLCSESSSAYRELVEVAGNGGQSGNEKGQRAGEVDRKIFHIQELITNYGAGVCGLDAGWGTQPFNDIRQGGRPWDDEKGVVLVNHLIKTYPSPGKRTSLQEDHEKAYDLQEVLMTSRHSCSVAKRPKLQLGRRFLASEDHLPRNPVSGKKDIQIIAHDIGSGKEQYRS